MVWATGTPCWAAWPSHCEREVRRGPLLGERDTVVSASSYVGTTGRASPMMKGGYCPSSPACLGGCHSIPRRGGSLQVQAFPTPLQGTSAGCSIAAGLCVFDFIVFLSLNVKGGRPWERPSRRELPDFTSWLQCFSLYAAVVESQWAYQATLIAERGGYCMSVPSGNRWCHWNRQILVRSNRACVFDHIPSVQQKGVILHPMPAIRSHAGGVCPASEQSPPGGAV